LNFVFASVDYCIAGGQVERTTRTDHETCTRDCRVSDYGGRRGGEIAGRAAVAGPDGGATGIGRERSTCNERDERVADGEQRKRGGERIPEGETGTHTGGTVDHRCAAVKDEVSERTRLDGDPKQMRGAVQVLRRINRDER